MDGGEEGTGLRDDGEVGKVIQMRRPYTPTQKDVDEHLPLRRPYRAWCAHCVAGRGISGHHAKSDKDDAL